MTTAVITIEVKAGDVAVVSDVIRLVAAEISSRVLRNGVEVGAVSAVLLDDERRIPSGEVE